MADVSRLTLRRRSPILAGLTGGLILVMLSAFWVVFAPAVAGGSFSYVFTAGNSIEPVFHQGDLVFLRTAERYGIGDMIAFRDPLQGVILHRIRAIEDGKFITRGDNRQSDDAFRSTDADVIGTVVGHVPGVGRALAELQTPRNSILLTIATLALGAAGATRVASLRRVRWQRPSLAGLAAQDRLAMVAPKRWASPMIIGSPGGNQVANGLALLLAIGVLIGIVVVSHGPTTTRPLPLIYEEKGTLGYTAKGTPDIYDNGIATSGDPVFAALADEVAFTFDYVVEGGLPTALLTDVKGTARVDAELSASNGWRRSVPIVAEVPLNGTATKLVGKLSLRDLRTLIERTEEATGVGFSQYKVRVSQAVKGEARVSGQPIQLEYNKGAQFTLDKYQIALSQGEQLFQGQSGTVTTTIREPWSVKVPTLGIPISYDWMRFTSIVLVVVSVGGLMVMGVATRMTERAGEAALIEARYADLLVPTDAAAIDFGGQLVGVAAFEDLARMARRTQGSILHCRVPMGDQFLLVEPGVTYLYSVSRVRRVTA